MKAFLTLFLVLLILGSWLSWIAALDRGGNAAQHMQTIAVAFIALYFAHRKTDEKEKPAPRFPADSKQKR